MGLGQGRGGGQRMRRGTPIGLEPPPATLLKQIQIITLSSHSTSQNEASPSFTRVT